MITTGNSCCDCCW